MVLCERLSADRRGCATTRASHNQFLLPLRVKQRLSLPIAGNLRQRISLLLILTGLLPGCGETGQTTSIDRDLPEAILAEIPLVLSIYSSSESEPAEAMAVTALLGLV